MNLPEHNKDNCSCSIYESCEYIDPYEAILCGVILDSDVRTIIFILDSECELEKNFILALMGVCYNDDKVIVLARNKDVSRIPFQYLFIDSEIIYTKTSGENCYEDLMNRMMHHGGMTSSIFQRRNHGNLTSQ